MKWQIFLEQKLPQVNQGKTYLPRSFAIATRLDGAKSNSLLDELPVIVCKQIPKLFPLALSSLVCVLNNLSWYVSKCLF